MIKKIYLDMDGVLADFEKKFIEYYGFLSLAKRDRKEWSKDWEDFILNKKGFEKLDWFPGGHKLLDAVRKTNLPIEILSSAGGKRFHGEVTAQKIKWLHKKGMNYKANIVTGRKEKAQYATPETLLIDDTDDVIKYFTQAGGHGILHKNINSTLKELEIILNK